MAAELLHIEIIATILAELPVKSLLRFKSVSKTWFNLITSPYFLCYHNQVCTHDEARRRLIFCVYDFIQNPSSRWYGGGYWKILKLCARDMQFKKTTNDFSIKILSGTKVIFSGFDLVCLAHQKSPTINVLNPSTHDVFVLPSYGEMSRDSFQYEFFGFAYLASTKEYMVLRFFKINIEGPDRGSLGVEMFKFDGDTNLECPSSSSWKMAKTTYPGFFESEHLLRSSEGPFVDRSMHWLLFAVWHVHIDIFSFDVDNEILHKIFLPMGTNNTTKFLIPPKLVDLDGRLGLLKAEAEAENIIDIATTISVWTLVEKHESLWEKMHTIELNRYRVSYLTRVKFCYMSKGEVLISIDECKGEELLYYNMEKKKLVRVKKEPFRILQMGFLKEGMFQGQSKGYHHHEENDSTITMDPFPQYVRK
ncbi:hypothetical protein LIER_14062 [Lithospermum erythrorhizon]|uniref:F-box domain-containing protein n=1 Tax=Lithospermum erythrorhizon TaxID=34254 RepID=A0AAV3PXP6_LITER